MRDLSQEMMVAAELRGDLVRIPLVEPGIYVRKARNLLEGQRPFQGPGSYPGCEVYVFHGKEDPEKFYTQSNVYDVVDEFDAFVRVFNMDPPMATCRIIKGVSCWDLTRNDLGPFVFQVGDKVVAVTVEADDEQASKDAEAD